MEQAMTTIAETAPVSKTALWTGRLLSGLVILFLLFDGAIKLVPWPVVTETMDRIGYGSSETLARSLGIITIVCTVLYAIPPTSILGAILLTGYLGGAMASHLRIGSPLFSVQRATTVKAPPERIFPLINDFHQWATWSPYENKDPAMKRSYSGTASGKGAVYAWEGNKNVGSGRMEILDASAPAKIVIKLDFFTPFEGHNTAEFK